MVDAYQAIDFTPDMVVTKDIMNTMNNNTQWIYDNTPRGRFVRDPKGVESRSHRLVIVSGRAHFKKSKKSPHDGKRIKFGSNMFSKKCTPSTTTGLGSTFPVHHFLTGPGKKSHPQNNGFQIRVFVPNRSGTKWPIPKNFVIWWQVMGWRDNNQNEY